MLASIGIDIPLLAFQMLNFVILAFVLKKFLYAPILKVINDRQTEIREGLELKEENEAKKTELKQEREEILKEAREEAQLLLEHKKKDAEKVKSGIIADANKEKEEILKQGREQNKTKEAELRKKVEDEVVDLAAAMAQKVITNSLTGQKQHQLIQREIDKLATAKVAQ